MSLQISSTNPAVRAVIEGSAPRPAQVAASRGILPLPQADLLEILVNFFHGEDPELKGNAAAALAEQDVESLAETVRSNNIAPEVLTYFAERTDVPTKLHESVVLNPRTPKAAVVKFAGSTTEGGLLELISFNQQLLIQNPAIIDAIISNPHKTPEAERRVVEFKREFFQKERGAQQIVSELRARGNEAAAEFLEQAEFASDMDGTGISEEDIMFLAEHIEVPDCETDDSWLSLEYIEEIYEETEEQRKAVFGKILNELESEAGDDEVSSERISMINRIIKMGIKDRVKLGMKGDREARNILIRDPNRLVACAVANNPRITEQEVELIAAMRTIPDEVLRQIATNRQWARNYNVMHNLARNPRTPIGNVVTILTRLQLRDLVAMSKNRNVSDAVRRQALRLYTSRTGGKPTF